MPRFGFAPVRRPSFRRQFVLGVGAESFSQVVTIGTQLLVLPILLVLWGSERYGTWLVLSAIPSYLLLADLGLSQVMANEITMRVAADDRDGARVATQTSWLMTSWMVVACTVLIALGLTFSPLASSFTPFASAFEVQLTVGALLASSLWWVALGNLSAAMRAAGLYGVMVLVNAIGRLVDAVITVLVAFLGGGFVAVALCVLAWRIVLGLTVSAVFYTRHPLYRPGLRHADTRLLVRMLRPSLAYFAMVLSHLLNLQGAIMIVGALLGPSAVVIVSAMRTLTRVGRMFSSVATNSIEPIFAQLAGGGVREKGRNYHRRLLAGTAVGLVLYIGGMLVLGERFLAWWTHGSVVGHHVLFYMLVAAAAFEIVWITLQVPVAATNRYSEFTLWFLGFSIAGAIALIVMAPWLGVAAAGLSSMSVHACMLVLLLIRARRGGSFEPRGSTEGQPAS